MSFDCILGRNDSAQILDDVFEWDVNSWSRAIDFWQGSVPTDISNKSVLELGARHGGLSLLFAIEGARVVCSDFGGPTDLALKLHTKYGVADLVTYEDQDATSIQAEDESFDIVAFKSVLGGIGRNDNTSAVQKAVSEIHRVLRPGGMLLFAENLSGSALHSILRKKFVRWGDSWNYLQSTQLKTTFAQFDDFKSETWGFWAGMGRTNTQRNILFHIDRIIAPIVPKNSRYIAFGVAHKSSRQL